MRRPNTRSGMNPAMAARFNSFFDRKSVIDVLDKKTRKAFIRGGQLIRKIARRRLRPRNRKAFPGESPTAWTPFLKKHIFYSLDRTTRTLVVGPVPVGSFNTAGALEHGGWATIRTDKGRRVRAYYRKFPFMKPALLAAKDYIPNLFAEATTH